MHLRDTHLVGAGAACAAVWLITGDWLGGVALFVLLASYMLVATGDKLYVLPMAITFHWMQTSLGVFYNGFTGRALDAIELSDYRPMVLVGLGCVFALAVGVAIGLRLIKGRPANRERPAFAFSTPLLVMMYVGTILTEETLLSQTAQFPSLRQIIVTFDAARLGCLFLLLRRLCAPPAQWTWFGAIVLLEVTMGITGYFAGFRDPLVLAILATLEVFDRSKTRHWLAVAAVAAVGALFAVVWMGIRSEYRGEFAGIDAIGGATRGRVERVTTLSSDFLKRDPTSFLNTADNLVTRLWAIYYPALALQRVPDPVPHTDGTILLAALQHVATPRVFFPGKADLPSDSEMVRKYANVMVAGREENTSIAFGYAAEAYIDFGIPLMFLPIFAWGVVIGVLYQFFRTRIGHRDLFVAFATLTFWLSLYLFERSWATELGVSVGLFVYLGVPTILLDRFLMVRVERERQTDFAAPTMGSSYPRAERGR